MKLEYLTDRIVLKAESELESQIISKWVSGNVRHSSTTYGVGGPWTGTLGACFSFHPLTPAQIAQRRRAAVWYRVREFFRRWRSLRLRVEFAD